MSTASEPRRTCATCGAVRPIRECVSIVDPETETVHWYCRDCLKDGKAGTGSASLDAWVTSVLDRNVRVAQRRKDATA